MEKNIISELGAQGYIRKWIMQIGFVGFDLILGIGSLVRLLQFEEHWYTGIPILVYAASILASGILHKTFYWRKEVFGEAI